MITRDGWNIRFSDGLGSAWLELGPAWVCCGSAWLGSARLRLRLGLGLGLSSSSGLASGSGLCSARLGLARLCFGLVSAQPARLGWAWLANQWIYCIKSTQIAKLRERAI